MQCDIHDNHQQNQKKRRNNEKKVSRNCTCFCDISDCRVQSFCFCFWSFVINLIEKPIRNCMHTHITKINTDHSLNQQQFHRNSPAEKQQKNNWKLWGKIILRRESRLQQKSSTTGFRPLVCIFYPLHILLPSLDGFINSCQIS